MSLSVKVIYLCSQEISVDLARVKATLHVAGGHMRALLSLLIVEAASLPGSARCLHDRAFGISHEASVLLWDTLLLFLADFLQGHTLDCALVLLVSLLGDLVEKTKNGGREHGPQ